MTGPLSQLKILDFTQLLPGPFCSLLMADMGAEVIKIEHPDRGDALRWMSLGKHGELAFAYLNRNKKSLALDLKQPESISLILELLNEYDIVLEGFRPGVMDKLGLGYADLSQQFPQLIYCSLSGYGQTGPLSQRAGHDINYISRAGVASLTQDKSGQPVVPGLQLADLSGAYQAALGVLAAYIHRSQSGEGQFIDISLCDSAYSLLGLQGAISIGANQNPKANQELLTGALPIYRFYECADQKYLAVGALEPQFHKRLIQHLNCEMTHESLERCFKQHPRSEWLNRLDDLDVCVEPVLNLTDLENDPHIIHRQLIIEVDGVNQPALPIKFSKTTCSTPQGAPHLGEHNEIIQKHSRKGLSFD